MAYFHTTVLDNQIKAMPTVSTASGAIANFDTDLTENLVSCVCEIPKATQSGSGTPSPTNPRTINGIQSFYLTANSDPKNITLMSKCYGGSCDIISDFVTVNYHRVNLGSLTYTVGTGGNTRFVAVLPEDGIPPTTASQIPDIMCEIFETVSPSTLYNGSGNYQITIHTNGYLWVRDTDYSDPNDFKTAMNNKYIVYALATPKTSYINSEVVISTMSGTNTISSSIGDIEEVKYFLTVGKAIS